jgi:DNA-binding PadR family transcriptional regulator
VHRQLLLLGLLRREDMHGYQLNEFIETDLGFCTDIKKPTAYYLLDRLADDGYITALAEDQPVAGRPPRKTYRITPTGERHFFELLRANLSNYVPHTFAGDMGIAFLDALPGEEAASLLAERAGAIQDALDKIRATPQHGGAMAYVIEHHILHLEAEVAWLNRVIGDLHANQPEKDTES